MEIKNITVVGSGTMGNGIAHVCASNGYNVTLIDKKNEYLDYGMATITKNLGRELKKEKISEADVKSTLDRISITTDIKKAANSQIVIEAIYEELTAKTEFWTDMEKICPPDVLFASNTSSIPITVLGSCTKRPEKFIGMHFMNPVPMMKLVELIRGMATSDETTKICHDLAVDLGKTPCEVNDSPGFIANRLLIPMINEACYSLMEGVATREAIDTVMKLGCNHPMGPLTLADFIGLDVCLAIMEVIYDGFSDSKYRPCPLLRKMVQSGWLGRKTGKGFYDYE